MVEKLSPKGIAYSLAIVAGVVYIVCAIFVAIVPTWTVSTFGALFHGIDISKIARDTVPISSTIAGLIEIIVLSLIIGWRFTVVYNNIK